MRETEREKRNNAYYGAHKQMMMCYLLFFHGLHIMFVPLQ